MYFTQEDYKKIQEWLLRNSVRDSDLDSVDSIKGDESVAIVKEGENKRIPLHYLIKSINKLSIPSFYNVTDKHRIGSLTLEQAISLIPPCQRQLGMVITFQNKNKLWEIVQFIGHSVYQWGESNLWRGIFDHIVADYMYHPDEEDITYIFKDEKKYLRFKDREYNEEECSGKGRIILRKNLRHSSTCSPLGKDCYDNIIDESTFTEENTIYVIRYDYKLKGLITIPKGSELHFEGGSITGGEVNLNGALVSGTVGELDRYFKECKVVGFAEDQFPLNLKKLWKIL